MRAHLPDPPHTLQPTTSDFLFNVRCTLDYLVSQLVISNGGIPAKSNRFPVKVSPKAHSAGFTG